MQKRFFNSIILILLTVISVSAQISPKDSIVFATMITPSGDLYFPGGELVERFGSNGIIGGSFQVKTRKNWIFGVQYNFMFGKNVKQDNVLDNLKTDNGFIIDEAGEPALIDMFHRGHIALLKGGRVLPHLLGKSFTIGPNENCGILLIGGIGYFQHKIQITGTTPQLTKEYLKGYDRFTSGVAASQFIGYQHLSNNRLLNFYFGFEFIEARTVNRRGYNYDEMAADTDKRLDIISGFKIGWALPLYKRVSDEYYYD